MFLKISNELLVERNDFKMKITKTSQDADMNEKSDDIKRFVESNVLTVVVIVNYLSSSEISSRHYTCSHLTCGLWKYKKRLAVWDNAHKKTWTNLKWISLCAYNGKYTYIIQSL